MIRDWEIFTKGVAIKLGQHHLKSVKLLRAPWTRPTLPFKIGSQILSSLCRSHQLTLTSPLRFLLLFANTVGKCTQPSSPKPQTLGTPCQLYICTLDCGQSDTGPEAKGQSSRRSSSSEVGFSALQFLPSPEPTLGYKATEADAQFPATYPKDTLVVLRFCFIFILSMTL